jgi:hypothetical protein
MARRLDWRFLLPNPTLHRVAYLGSGEESLLGALRRFSDSLSVLTSTDGRNFTNGRPLAFDLIVVNSSSPPIIKAVSSFLAPGGYLYWEIGRRVRFPSFRNPTSNGEQRKLPVPRLRGNHAEFLGQLGFSDVQLHWHHPDFDHCRQIIPLRDRRAVEYALARDSVGFRRRVGLAAARYLNRSGLLARVVPCISMVARKGPVSATA